MRVEKTSHIFWLFHKLCLDLETDMNIAYFYKVEEMRMMVEEIGRDEDGVGNRGREVGT